MATWLLKSEAGAWSWDQQVARGKAGEPWSGVRNHQAANFMKEMKAGDLAFFYHSGDEKRIVGIVRIVKEYHPDPTDETGRFGMVHVVAAKAVPRPVSLAAIKADPSLADLLLVRHTRLSVMPIPEPAWKTILAMGGLAPKDLSA